MLPRRRHPSRKQASAARWSCRAAVSFLACALPAFAQNPQPPTMNSPAVAWVQLAAQHELRIIDDDGTFPVRYTVHKIDSHGDNTRVVIESKQGGVARTILHDGKPLTPEADTAERQRLNDILADPATWLKHQKRDLASRSYATDLIKLMPSAMIYTYVPGQPQPPNATTPQIVIDFKPDPSFQPPSTLAEVLTGIEGRMFIDPHALVLTRVEGRIVRPVNFGWGMLAHFYPGGTIDFEQSDAGSGRWIYSHVDENITVREMMVHTSVEKNKMTATDIHLLPAPIDYRDAIQTLLNMPLPH